VKKIPVIILFFILLSAPATFAIETAPRITDREIIESLAEIKATQIAILQRFGQVDKQFEQVDKQFEQVDKRFEQVDKRFEQVDKRFEQVNKRFEQVDKRFDETNASNRMFHGFIISILIALFGYIIWDRRTLMKPLESKIIDIERELDIGSTDGNKIIRLINALRELSKEDEKVANVLRRFHLL